MDRQAWVEHFKKPTLHKRRRAVLLTLEKIVPVQNEHDDPVDAARPDPPAVFSELAKHGLTKSGDKLDIDIIEFAIGVVDLCAGVADGYGDTKSGGNAGKHIRARSSHPFVTGAPFIRFYAAARLSIGELIVGMLCVYDIKPHQLTEGQMLDLRVLAKAAIHVLETRQQPASAVQNYMAGSVMVVDDNAKSSRLWAELINLAEPAFSVDVRTDWPSAMVAILSKRPWAVIADLKRASLDSLTAAASIRAVLGDSSPILIAFSADLFALGGSNESLTSPLPSLSTLIR